jgi:hypothetical protein
MKSKFSVRSIKPTVSDWFSVMAESETDAMQEFQLKYVPGFVSGIRHIVNDDRGGSHHIYFNEVEVDGFPGSMISKIICHGIFRAGRRVNVSISEVANLLDWGNDPNLLLESWEGEETIEEAKSRLNKTL